MIDIGIGIFMLLACVFVLVCWYREYRRGNMDAYFMIPIMVYPLGMAVIGLIGICYGVWKLLVK